MNYKETSKKIMKAVGGADNIEFLSYCATRLRFELKNRDLADREALEKMEEVLGVNITPNVFQLIIGADVQNLYREMSMSLEGKNPTNETKPIQRKEKNIFNSMMNALAASMTPIIPAIYAAGLISAILAIVKAVNPEITASSTYLIFNSIQQSIFYFLPILVGSSAAKRFGCNPYIGMSLGALLVYSAINGVEGLTFFGIAVPVFQYNATILPVVLGIWFMSYVDRFSDKVLPKQLIFFFKPVLSLFITVPVTLLVFGPLGAYFGELFGQFISWVSDSIGGWIVPAIKGATNPISVLTGTTGIFVPIVMGSITEVGYDPLIMPGSLCANVAVGGAVIALAVITRNKETKNLSISSGTTALLGITEPAVYGILIKFKLVFAASIIGGGIGGLIAGLAGIRCYSPIASLIGLPAYIDNSPYFRNLLFAILSATVAFLVAFLIVYLMRSKILEDEQTELGDIESPVKGKKKDIRFVKDETFASMVLGKGIAIEPEEGIIVAPGDGTVVSLFDTHHAIGLKLNNGIELLIHIGIDTIKLNGEHFTSFVRQGDHIVKGQKLISFDIDAIRKKGYDADVILIVTNSDDLPQVKANLTNQDATVFSFGEV